MAAPYTAWETPRELFDHLNSAVGGFAVDAAADQANRLVSDWYGPGSPLGEDALEVEEWLSPAWCNPPYGRGLTKWLEKFNQQGQLGVHVVALLPAYVERVWWKTRVVDTGADIIFLTGRVSFVRGDGQPASSPRDPSALVIFGPSSSGRVGWLDWRKRPSNVNKEVASDRGEDSQGAGEGSERGTGEG